jgi:enoyl-CoA hydratase
LELLPQPVIAVLGGDAGGAGLDLALACDLRLAHAGARFAMPLAGDCGWFGGTQRLPRLVGRSRATEMLLLGESVSADTALEWGLVNAVAEDLAALQSQAERLCLAIAARGPLAVRYAKEAINRGFDLPLDQALRYETDLTVILQTTDDRAEGVRAFLEKRQPSFRGR